MTLDVVAYWVHVMLKFHNLHGEPITVNTDLIGANRIYQTLQQYQKIEEYKVMDNNVALLLGYLRNMNVRNN